VHPLCGSCHRIKAPKEGKRPPSGKVTAKWQINPFPEKSHRGTSHGGDPRGGAGRPRGEEQRKKKGRFSLSTPKLGGESSRGEKPKGNQMPGGKPVVQKDVFG